MYWVRIDAEGNPGEVVRLSTYPGSNKFDDESPQIAVDAKGNFSVTWYTVQWYEDEGIPRDVYWVRIDAEGASQELQRISLGDLQCESSPKSDTNMINSFISAFLAYWIYIFVSIKGGIIE